MSVAGRMKITPEEFTRWRESPMTEWFMQALKIGAEQKKQAWISTSWDGGQCDPLVLHSHRERADAYLNVTELTLDDLIALQTASEPE